MKKIVFCTDSLNVGGIEKALITLVNAIYEDGKYEVKICVKDYEKNYLQEFINNNIEVKYITREKKQRHFFRVFEKMREFRIFKDFIQGADVIIDYYDGNWYKFFSQIKNKKKIVFFHTILEKLHIYNQKNLKKILTEVYDKYVILSEGAKKELIDNGVNPDKIQKIYNIINAEEILEKSKDESSLAETDKKILNEEYYISIGRLVNDSKDYMTLIEAFAQLDEKLYIVGDGPFRGHMEKKIKELGQEEKIILLGQKKNPYIWLKNSKGLVVSSRYEGLPTVILEALVLQKTVIASDCPYGCREILGDSEYGELFAVGDVRGLIGKIRDDVGKSISENNRINEFFKEQILRRLYKIL